MQYNKKNLEVFGGSTRRTLPPKGTGFTISFQTISHTHPHTQEPSHGQGPTFSPSLNMMHKPKIIRLIVFS